MSGQDKVEQKKINQDANKNKNFGNQGYDQTNNQGSEGSNQDNYVEGRGYSSMDPKESQVSFNQQDMGTHQVKDDNNNSYEISEANNKKKLTQENIGEK